jgi:hypothetical protein
MVHAGYFFVSLTRGIGVGPFLGAGGVLRVGGLLGGGNGDDTSLALDSRFEFDLVGAGATVAFKIPLELLSTLRIIFEFLGPIVDAQVGSVDLGSLVHHHRNLVLGTGQKLIDLALSLVLDGVVPPLDS